MQFEQRAPGDRVALPRPSIDTGMGLERVAAVMQGKHDNYDIDLFQNLIQAIQQESVKAGAKESRIEGGAEFLRVAQRVIADHLRSTSFLMADGVLPSNEGRGYVLRRIMRRAMRYAHQIGCVEPLMYTLVPALVREMGDAYPELVRAQPIITETLKLEETKFKRTLDNGLKLLGESSSGLKKGAVFPGDVAFKLYDTYGFPLDLTEDALKPRGITRRHGSVPGRDEKAERSREGRLEGLRAKRRRKGCGSRSRIKPAQRSSSATIPKPRKASSRRSCQAAKK